MVATTSVDNAGVCPGMEGACEGPDREALENILAQDVDMAIWRRAPSPELCRELMHLPTEWRQTIRLNTAVINVKE